MFLRMFEAIGSPMFWTLCLLVLILAVALIFTIAYLFVYLGYFTALDIQVKDPELSELMIAFKGTFDREKVFKKHNLLRFRCAF